MTKMATEKGGMRVTEDSNPSGIIHDGSFLCYACLDRKDLVHISPDPRYCQGCYDFLVDEAKQLRLGEHPNWVPRQPNGAEKLSQKSSRLSSEAGNTSPFLGQGGQGQGRPRKAVSLAAIKALRAEGLTVRAIAARLEDEGQKVSRSTIFRVIREAPAVWLNKRCQKVK